LAPLKKKKREKREKELTNLAKISFRHMTMGMDNFETLPDLFFLTKKISKTPHLIAFHTHLNIKKTERPLFSIFIDMTLRALAS